MNDSKRNSEKMKRKLYDEANKESMITRDQNKEQQLNFPHERPKRETILKYYNGII